MMLQVTAPHFCAGLILVDGICVVAAPILGWCLGRREDELLRYFTRKRWTWERCQ